LDTVEVVMAIEEVWVTNYFIGKRQGTDYDAGIQY